MTFLFSAVEFSAEIFRIVAARVPPPEFEFEKSTEKRGAEFADEFFTKFEFEFSPPEFPEFEFSEFGSAEFSEFEFTKFVAPEFFEEKYPGSGFFTIGICCTDPG